MTLVSMIVAVADNGVIGNAGGKLGMPWHIKSEFQYFKKTTMGFPVLMGRKSFEALGSKPLPGRANIIVTRDQKFTANNVIVVHTLQDAITEAKKIAAETNRDEIFICGGAEIYKQGLPFTDKLYYTEIHLKPEGDIIFPAFDRTQWQEIKREPHKALDGETADYTITVLTKK